MGYPDLGIEVFGAGISGNKVPNCQARLDRDVIQKAPTVVVIYIGINDVWHWTLRKRGGKGFREGTTPEQFESGCLSDHPWVYAEFEIPAGTGSESQKK